MSELRFLRFVLTLRFDPVRRACSVYGGWLPQAIKRKTAWNSQRRFYADEAVKSAGIYGIYTGGIKTKFLSGDEEPQYSDKQTNEKNYLAIQQSLPVASIDDNQPVFEAPFIALTVQTFRHVTSFP
ncbi:hypothetical protein [Thiobacillus denitrificans]|uniref:hypothetical protein n=1 Tax=Thiobacillus denitrificans TaxID=36861 RepID=UPI0012FB1433|nr:hypothetical protein [Thiobacillus denitrificans]